MEYFKNESEFVPDKLFAGTAVTPITGFVELEKGQGFLERGTLIGKSESGKYFVMGSEVSGETNIVPYGILTDSVDTADKNVNISVYLSGIFNRSAVFLAGDENISKYEYELRKLSIYLEDAAE